MKNINKNKLLLLFMILLIILVLIITFSSSRKVKSLLGISENEKLEMESIQYTDETNGVTYNLNVDEENNSVASVTGYTYKGSNGNIVIPNTIVYEAGKTYVVNKIDAYSFAASMNEDAYNIESIQLPASIEIIDYRAFYKCSNLTQINIPEGVQEIGEETFYNCSKLSSITIPDSVTKIGNDAFSGCASDFIIYCSINSYARTYAIQKGLSYTLIGDAEDNIAPIITQTHSTYAPTDGNVIVELVANEPIAQYGDWTLLDDQLTLRKEYSENVNEEKIYVVDLAGNQTEVTITIDNIYYTIILDQQGGTGGIDNLYVFKNDGIYKDIERNQKIEENSDGSANIGILPTKAGYKFIGYKDSSNVIITDLNGEFIEGLYDSLKAGNKEISNNMLYAQWLDNTPPQVTVSYSTIDPTYDSVTVLITSNEVLQAVNGWTLVGNGESMQKKYTENVNEEITVSDEAGNTTSVRIEINNIKNKEYRIVLNKNGGTGGIDYLYVVCKDGIYKDVTHTQKLEATNGSITITELPTKEGLSFNGYSTEQNGGNIDIDANGQTGSGTYQYMIWTYNSTEDYNLYAQWIDNTPPQVTVSYSTTEPTYDSVTATIISNEVLQPVEGWTLIGNCKTMEKRYTENVNEEITVSDEAGNTASVRIVINNIKNKEYRIVLNKNGGTGGIDYLYVVCKDGIYNDVEHTQRLDDANGKVSMSGLPTKEGYSFRGYSTEQDGSSIWIDSYGQIGWGTYQYLVWENDSAGDYNLYAQWIDNTPPQVTVSYSTTEPTYDSVTATIISNEVLQPVEGWTLIGNCKTMEKKYTENTEEEVTVSDEAGNTTSVRIVINNIKNKEYRIVLNKNGGTGGIDYLYVVCKDGIYKDVAHTQKLEATNGSITITELPTKEGLSFNGYSTEQNGGNIEIDANGQTGSGTYQYMIWTYNSTEDYNLYAQWIDNTPPQVTVSYSTTEPTNEGVTVTITGDKQLQEVEGWKLSSDKKELTKIYNENKTEKIKIRDLLGNETEVEIKISNICKSDDTEIKGDINKDGEVDITDLLILKRHIIAGSRTEWIISDDKITIADINEDGEVDITDLLLMKRTIVAEEEKNNEN